MVAPGQTVTIRPDSPTWKRHEQYFADGANGQFVVVDVSVEINGVIDAVLRRADDLEGRILRGADAADLEAV